eukprot:Hpha_TRINITY_DN34833_c0_g1::TRINITY_DN34833_c0_g1_i1::g.167921::m.167921
MRAQTSPVRSGRGSPVPPLIGAAVLPDEFECLRGQLLRRGGAVIHYAGVAGGTELHPDLLLVILAPDAVWVWNKDGVLCRALPVSLVTEAVDAGGGWVGLRVPTEHDMVLPLPPGSHSDFLAALSAIQPDVAVREVPLAPGDLARRLWLQPRAGWRPSALEMRYHDSAPDGADEVTTAIPANTLPPSPVHSVHSTSPRRIHSSPRMHSSPPRGLSPQPRSLR